MSQVLEPEPIEEQHGFFKQYVKIAGRKARCALCHGKILIDAPYSVNNGLICHDTCIEETKNLDNNVRRRTLKLMGIGAAFAGATAIGASRLASASGVQQTQITANGVILPSLTFDPANPEPGQMWYRSDAGVIAHFDAIENRVIYSNRIVDGSAFIIDKGIVNGLSVLPNDGQDWGPDTMLGATAPGQYGPPYTETGAAQEAFNYSKSLSPSTVSLHLLGNNITISSDVHWDLDDNTPGVDVHGYSAARITSSNGSAVYLGTNMNVDSVGFNCDVVINQQTNVTLTRNAFSVAVYIVAPSSAIQFVDANYIFSPIFYTSSDATAIPSGGNGVISNLIIVNNIFPAAGVAILNFHTNYGASGVTIEDVLMANLVFAHNVGGVYPGSAAPNILLPYVTPNYYIDIHGMSTDTTSSSNSFITIYGTFTPTGQAYNALQANPPVSGTVYQNINQYDIEIDLPVYATTAGTAGYVTIAKGPSSTPMAIGNQYVNGATSSTSTDIIKLRVPAGWYYSFTASGVTFGNASVFAD